MFDQQPATLPSGLLADLPQGVWQDRFGDFYSVDGRSGTWRIKCNHVYYRVDLCQHCHAEAIIEWSPEPADYGIEFTHCPNPRCPGPNPGEAF